METVPVQLVIWIVGLFLAAALGFMTGFRP